MQEETFSARIKQLKYEQAKASYLNYLNFVFSGFLISVYASFFKKNKGLDWVETAFLTVMFFTGMSWYVQYKQQTDRVDPLIKDYHDSFLPNRHAQFAPTKKTRFKLLNEMIDQKQSFWENTKSLVYSLFSYHYDADDSANTVKFRNLIKQLEQKNIDIRLFVERHNRLEDPITRNLPDEPVKLTYIDRSGQHITLPEVYNTKDLNLWLLDVNGIEPNGINLLQNNGRIIPNPEAKAEITRLLEDMERTLQPTLAPAR